MIHPKGRKFRGLLAGYTPGKLLVRLRTNLPDWTWEDVAPGHAKCSPPDSPLSLDVIEQGSQSFMMSVTTAEFRFRFSHTNAPEAELAIGHAGAVTRKGVTFRPARGQKGQVGNLIERLEKDGELLSALQALDFSSCHLAMREGEGEFRLVHFGASEVAIRFPPFRRYIRLVPEQSQALVTACTRLNALLSSS